MFRSTGYFFAGLLGVTLFAFWPSYVAKLPGSFDRYTHLHAVLMLAWFALLIAQPFLVRAGRRPLHRALGRITYGLVPAIVVVTILLTHARMSAVPAEQFGDVAKFFYLPLSMTVLFAFAYVLAIVHRHKTALHARYMIGTCFALVDPILGRTLYRIVPDLPGALAPVASYLVIALVLGALIVRERNDRSGRRAFPIMLAASTIVFALFFTFAQTGAWRAFAWWFRDRALT